MFPNTASRVIQGCSLAALVALGLPVFAQQSIQFSTPVQDEDSSNNVVYPAHEHKAPAAFNAPKSLFEPPTRPTAFAPPASPVINRKPQNEWTLMTPAQILSVPTPESIMGITKAEDDFKFSPEQTYLKRRETEHTNAWARANDNLKENDPFFLLKTPEDGLPADSSPFSQARIRNVAELFGQDKDKQPASLNSKRDSLWNNPFDSLSSVAPKSTPAQVAEMRTFQQLLESCTEKSPVAASSALHPMISTPYPAASPMTPPVNNILARSPYQILENPLSQKTDMAKPVGITPLPALITPLPITTKKSSLVQQPPWMTGSTAHSSPVVRQF